MSLGAPLVRKVEPKKWVLESGFVLGGSVERTKADEYEPCLGGYAYVGRGLGEHFEFGILPYGYIYSDYAKMGALFIPVKWDPLPYDKAKHVVLFAGPVLYADSGGYLDRGLGPAGTIGIFPLSRRSKPEKPKGEMKPGDQTLLHEWAVILDRRPDPQEWAQPSGAG